MLKVAVYCRVSTDKEDQANSFESQGWYFKAYIERQPDWELYDIYADEGKSGTSTKKRAGFNRMIADAHLGRFDLIITKEISRFARNTADSITYTRELKKLGVGVFFLNDNLNTLKEESELFLSIKSTIAQDESRATSQRVKWGQTRQMEKGVVFGRSMLGYDVNGGKMTVNPEGAQIVRLIYQKYVMQRKGTSVIARELREAGYKTLTGNYKWTNTVILKILRNEKYCGDLCQKKTYTPNYLDHEKKYNKGEEPFVFIKDHHEPIISRELWDEAQRELKRRDVDSKVKEGHGNRYPLSGKIKCSECSATFVSRKKTRRDGSIYKCWRCGTAAYEGTKKLDQAGNEIGCNVGRQLRDEIAMNILKQSVDSLPLDRDVMIGNISNIVSEVIASSEGQEQVSLARLEKEAEDLKEKKAAVLDAFFSKQITKEEMRQMCERYDAQLQEVTGKMDAAKQKQKLVYSREDIKKDVKEKIKNILTGADKASEDFYGLLLNKMTVYPDDTIEVALNLLPTKWVFIT